MKKHEISPSLRRLLPALLLLGPLAAPAAARELPPFFYGVTLDDVPAETSGDAPFAQVLKSLKGMKKMPVARVVFNGTEPAANYVEALGDIRPSAYIMGEFLDSFEVKDMEPGVMGARAAEYYAELSGLVDVWEVGNEINGEWLGEPKAVTAKLALTYDYFKSRGAATALTLYYNEGCYEKPENEMFTWAAANIPEKMKQGLDYVLVSYYEDDCNGLKPDWDKVFKALAVMFPSSRLGMGECGTTKGAAKEEMVKRYYAIRPAVPAFSGGYFWWYFQADMVPPEKPLYKVLNDSVR